MQRNLDLMEMFLECCNELGKPIATEESSCLQKAKNIRLATKTTQQEAISATIEHRQVPQYLRWKPSPTMPQKEKS